MTNSTEAPPGKRAALEAAAHEVRVAQDVDRDEILSAERSLRKAEKAHDRAVRDAERVLAGARASRPLAAYGHHLILYEDRVSTADGNHELDATVKVSFDEQAVSGERGEASLSVLGSGWREVVTYPRRDERKVLRLGQQIEVAAANSEAIIARRRGEIEAAMRRLEMAKAERREIFESQALLRSLGHLIGDEQLLDIAPGISAGNEGVLVATDEQLLFIGVRRRLSLRYAEIDGWKLQGKRLSARLVIRTSGGRTVIGGLRLRHAAEIAELLAQRVRS